MNEQQIIKDLSESPHEEALIWASKQDGSPTGNPPGFVDGQRSETHRIFIAYGLIMSEHSLGYEWTLTPLGRRVAQKLETSMQSGPRRRSAVQKAMLNFFDDHQPDIAEEFINEQVDGLPATSREFKEAFEALTEWKFITSTYVDHGKHTHARVTTSGREAKDDPRSPSDSHQNRGTTINNDNRNHIENNGGTIGNAGVGAHVVQIGNTFNSQQLSDLRMSISELKTMLSEIGDAPETVTSAVAQMEIESSSPDPTPSKLQALLGTAMAGLATRMGEETYQPLVEGFGRVAALLGLG